MLNPGKRMEQRISRLQEQLSRENPILVEVVDQYRQLDKVAQRVGLLGPNESYATQISWWPMVSILGTFSAGKSSFINTYLGIDLQRSGNQAVDDRFTVITYSPDGKTETLPGLALDGDPRFPFYQISEEIERVAAGEGAKVNNYLQMKVAPSEKLKGRILIDSPGFDADAQRKATLRITDHIIELSDLVLVFFDARHPEPGAMQDTLEHLVKGAQRRNDNNKFLFILNQIDTAAREDNLEDIVSSWQKALAQAGLATGNFYVIYNERLAQPVADEQVWRRYQEKRNTDYKRMMDRIAGVNTERVYRITGNMESIANNLEQQAIPSLEMALQSWRKKVLMWDGIILGSLLVGGIALTAWLGYWNGIIFNPPWGDIGSSPIAWILFMTALAVSTLVIHFSIRSKVATSIAAKLPTREIYGNLQRAFQYSTRPWRSIFQHNPRGWGFLAKRGLATVRDATDRFVQSLNDVFTKPAENVSDVNLKK
jgi:predicted GTPase